MRRLNDALNSGAVQLGHVQKTVEALCCKSFNVPRQAVLFEPSEHLEAARGAVREGLDPLPLVNELLHALDNVLVGNREDPLGRRPHCLAVNPLIAELHTLEAQYPGCYPSDRHPTDFHRRLVQAKLAQHVGGLFIGLGRRLVRETLDVFEGEWAVYSPSVLVTDEDGEYRSALAARGPDHKEGNRPFQQHIVHKVPIRQLHQLSHAAPVSAVFTLGPTDQRNEHHRVPQCPHKAPDTAESVLPRLAIL
mmetsp:Transcript_18927/g.46048  ORF Transcript_18927/g.46048 Transcript_18927/m.46048 type:complete len:249 (+) Transcript_18927:1794-2540(+)